MKVLFPPSLPDVEGVTGCELNGVPVNWTYIQPEDCCGRTRESEQSINIKIEDGGAGSYVVFETDRFAFDFDELIKLAKNLKKLGKAYDKRNKL